MKHVIFSPWVGKHYHTGWNGKRMMVLGESHYCASSEEAVPQITNRIITDLMDADSEHEGYKNTYTKFANALAGKFLSFDERKRLWHSVLFYNYVQVPMSGARISPTTQEFAQSETAFFEVLETYRPGCIIAWGKRLYNNLPRRGYQFPDLALPNGDSMETWAYETSDGQIVEVLPITHPSAAFVPSYWHEVIQMFLNRIP